MRVLVLGAGGMLGHKLLQRLSATFEVVGTMRGDASRLSGVPALFGVPLVGGVSADQLDTVAAVVQQVAPDVVVNCIGVVKQRDAAKDPVTAIAVNALFPHQVAEMARDAGARLVHVSTDCVFSGRGGPYRQADVPDPVDLYGRSKLLGEVSGPGCLTLRTSIIGRELSGGTGLLEWFLAQEGQRVRGYDRALYSGLTTLALSDLVAHLLTDQADLEGLWHVSGPAISKYDLLSIVASAYELDVDIQKDTDFFCDRRLDSAEFQRETGFRPQTWERMITDLRSDPTAYGTPTSTA